MKTKVFPPQKNPFCTPKPYNLASSLMSTPGNLWNAYLKQVKTDFWRPFILLPPMPGPVNYWKEEFCCFLCL